MKIIDADALIESVCGMCDGICESFDTEKCRNCRRDGRCEWRKSLDEEKTIEARPVVRGEWVLTAHEEYANCRWNVTAECSECHHDKGEIYAGFFTGFPPGIAEEIIKDCALSVKLDNFCPNCGADMRGEEDG